MLVLDGSALLSVRVARLSILVLVMSDVSCPLEHYK